MKRSRDDLEEEDEDAGEQVCISVTCQAPVKVSHWIAKTRPST